MARCLALQPAIRSTTGRRTPVLDGDPVAGVCMRVDGSFMPISFVGQCHKLSAALAGAGSDNPANRRPAVDIGLEAAEGEEAADQAEQHRDRLGKLPVERYPHR